MVIRSEVRECMTRPMTPEERTWIDSLPKPRAKERIIGMNVTTDKAMKRKSQPG